ncbi:MAG TPA: ATP-binding protein [Chthoniobacterales bacterium]
MSIPWWLPWLLLELATAGSAFFLWRQLVRLHHGVRGLVTEGKLPYRRDGPTVVQATFKDLYRLEVRLREIGQQIADEDFSLRAILSSMVEGVLILDRQFQVRLINQRLQDMFQLPRAPLGRTVMEVFRNHLLHQVIQRTLGTGSPQFEELQMEVNEGERPATRHFQVTSVGMRPDREGGSAGILVIFHDITQMRALEAVRKEFVANVSHELRTPLSILSGYLETLLDDEVDPVTTKRFLETMHRHAKRLNALVEDLLLLSQLESRRLPLHLESVGVRSCFQQVLERFDSVIQATQTAVTVVAPEELTVQADPFRVEQALFNLIDNALKYGGKPGLKLTLRAEVEGNDLVIRVIDNGPGIPLSDQPHIFERFYRVYKDRSRDGGGTGLGLSIVKHTVLAHGGSVGVDSSPGKGSTFILRLPLVPVS